MQIATDKTSEKKIKINLDSVEHLEFCTFL